MNVLDYYISQQQFKLWYDKFQSTGGGKSGKIFSYTSTNYRKLLSFLDQLSKFEHNDGLERSEWGKQKRSGQEKDKHRIVNLINANLLKFETDCYFFTNLGYTCCDLIAEDIKEEEKWILLYLLLLPYKSEEREYDILLSTKEYFDYILEVDLEENWIMKQMEQIMLARNNEELFMSEIFWILTFAKDKKFLELFINSSKEEKDKLGRYVNMHNKNKKSKDCIAHKFVSGGAYTKGTFVDEVKVLYYTRKILNKEVNDFEEFFEYVSEIYIKNNITVKKEVLKSFIDSHRSVYKYVFDKTFKKEE